MKSLNPVTNQIVVMNGITVITVTQPACMSGDVFGKNRDEKSLNCNQNEACQCAVESPEVWFRVGMTILQSPYGLPAIAASIVSGRVLGAAVSPEKLFPWQRTQPPSIKASPTRIK